MDKIIESQISKIKEECEILKPLVVIHSLAYNHGPYIRETLDSFINQKTDFPFVAIIHEDASTDNTADIIRQYAEAYPDIIKPIFEKENQYSKGNGSLSSIMHAALKSTGAQYVAMCECDDYWTDALKLQKQVDFLKSHPEISYVCHDFSTIDGKGKIQKTNNYKLNKGLGFEFDIHYAFTKRWITKTLTSLFHIDYLPAPEILNQYQYNRDVHLIYYILKGRKGYYLNENMGVYRNSGSGVFSQYSDLEKYKLAYDIYKEFYSIEHNHLIKECLSNAYQGVLRNSLKKGKLPKPTSWLEYKGYFLLMPKYLISKLFMR